jgi:hypothetical protein
VFLIDGDNDDDDDENRLLRSISVSTHTHNIVDGNFWQAHTHDDNS